jgi:hypothetical protein
MPTMFDFAKGMLQQAGLQTGNDWDETKQKTSRQVVAQLSRPNIRPATVVKWHRVGALVNARPQRKQA